MKNILPILIIAFAIIFSCQKKDDPTPANITTAGATTSATAGTTAGGSAATFNGACSNQKIYSITAGTTYSVANAQNTAVFTNALINNFNIPVGPFLNAGNLNLNNKLFKNSSYSYSDSTNISAASPFIWSCTGASIPAFTVTNINPYATYADYVYWPDTIKKSENFTISLTGSHNADEVQILIAKSGSTVSITYTALTSAGLVNISAGSLSPLSTLNTAVIQCNFYKNNIQTIGGSLINFRNVTSFVKTVPVKN